MKKALHYRIWKDSHLKGFLETRIKSWGTNVFAYVLAASLQKPNFRYCCLTNVHHWRLVFQAHLWAFTAAFQTLIFVRPFSLWKKKKKKFVSVLKDSLTQSIVPWALRRGQMACIVLLLPAIRSGVTSWHSATFPSSPPSWINTKSLAFLTWKRSPELSHTGLRPSGRRALMSAVYESVPFASQPWPDWGTLNSFPCLRGRKHIYSLQRGLLLWLCLNAFPPVSGAVRRAGGKCEISVWEGCWPGGRVSGPAVDLLLPIGLLPGKVCLISYTCATSCLSHRLA